MMEQEAGGIEEMEEERRRMGERERAKERGQERATERGQER